MRPYVAYPTRKFVAGYIMGFGFWLAWGAIFLSVPNLIGGVRRNIASWAALAAIIYVATAWTAQRLMA